MKSIFTVLIFTNLLLANSGANIYAKCAGCHGQSGEKAALGKSAMIGGQSASKTIEQLRGYRVGTLNIYGMGGVMKGQVATLSDNDITNLAAHIEQLGSGSDKSKSSVLDLSTQVVLCSAKEDDQKIKACLKDLLDKSERTIPIIEKSSSKKEVPPKVVDNGKWDVSITTSEIDDSQKVILMLSSDNTILASYKTTRPTLILRCSENKTEAYVSWDTFLGTRSAKILSRYDKEKAHTRSWGISTDNKASFAPGGNVSYIKKLLKHKKLLLQVTPYSDSPVTAKFDLRGINEAIKPLRKACHW